MRKNKYKQRKIELERMMTTRFEIKENGSPKMTERI